MQKFFQYSDCSLLSHSDKEIPKESYNDQIKSTNGSPVSTYVPFRNGLFLSSAASIALQKAAVRYIMEHMQMMQLEVHILIVAAILIMQ